MAENMADQANLDQAETSESVDSDEEVDDDEGVAGIILKLELTNFMCHASLALDFNPALNFIVGKNGSGKSAIMTALMVVLGSRASDTSRGRTLANFIKVGANQAKIRITLKNTGTNSYKREEFGDTITLVRIINKSGGQFSIQRGKILAHLTRNRLDNILQAFNINLPNAFALLTQETMKTFLNSSKPQQLYHLIREGTGIQTLQRKVKELHLSLEFTKNKEQTMQAQLDGMKKELKIWREKKKILNKLTDTKDKITTLEQEVLWAKVIEEEARLKSFQDQLQKFLAQKREREKMLEAHQQKQDKLRETIKEAEAALNAVTVQHEAKQAERMDLQCAFEASRNRAESLRREVMGKDSQLRAQRIDMNFVNEQLAKMNKHSMAEEVERRAQQQQMVQQMQAELANIKATKVTLATELNRLREEARAGVTAVTETRAQFNELRNKYRQERRDLETSKKQTGTLPPIYGPKMAIFLKEIEKAHAQKQFSRKPLGPMGMHIKVKDQAWALAVEGFLRGEFTSFFVNSDEDRVKLTQICNRVMPNFRLTVVASKFVDQVFDVRRHKAQASGKLLNLMDMLVVDEPAVMNYFIDQRSVETVLLCPTTEEAMKLMCDAKSVPHNCKQMITKDAEQIYPFPLYRFYSSDIRNVQFLVESKEASIQVLEEHIAEGEARVSQLEQELRQLESQNQRAKVELGRTQRQMQQAEEKELELERQVEANKEEELDNEDAFSHMTAELESIKQKTAAVEEEKKELLQNIEAAKQERKEKENALKALVNDFAAISASMSACKDKKYEIENQLETERTRAEFDRRKLNETAEREEKLTQDMQNQEQKVQEAEGKATEACPRMNTKRTTGSVQKEIQSLNAFMETLNSNLEDSETIINSITTLEVKEADLQKKVKQVHLFNTGFTEDLELRKANYHATLQLTFVHISEYFRLLVSTQHYEGTVVFDHTNKTMDINLTMKGKNKEKLKNLSGGERSWTTIVLILSVWEKMLIPFYMLDEFDVYMDIVNRDACTKLLVQEAGDKKGRQFMFFTPQEMNMEASANTTIHKLSDPRAS